MKRLSLVVLMAMTGMAQAAPFEVTDGWFRSLPGKLPAGGYFNAQNNTAHDITITGVRSDGCGMLMMHLSSQQGGMSGMDMVDKIKVPAGGKIAFTPGSYHLMCSDSKLKIGTKVSVLLNLSDGTSVAAPFAVKNATGK